MTYYRKKPIKIQALKWDGRSVDKFRAYTEEQARFLDNKDGTYLLVIHTLEGSMSAQIGDWVIKGIDGEFYPCKPDIFERTYEKVPSQSTNDVKGDEEWMQ